MDSRPNPNICVHFQPFLCCGCFCYCFRPFGAFCDRPNDHLRASKACLEWFSEPIHPGYSKSGMKMFHLTPVGSLFVAFDFVVLRIRNLSVVLTLHWGDNRINIDTAICSMIRSSTPIKKSAQDLAIWIFGFLEIEKFGCSDSPMSCYP